MTPIIYLMTFIFETQRA